MRKIRPVPFNDFLIHQWVAVRTIDKCVARLDQGMALTLRRDAYFSIVGTTTRLMNDIEIGSNFIETIESD